MRNAVMIGLATVLAACGQPAATEKAPTAASDIAPKASAPAQASDAATAAAGVPSQSRSFRDWLAVCDNLNACYAFGPAVEGETGWIRISAPAGPNPRRAVAVGFWPSEGDAVRGNVALQVDGRSFALLEQKDTDGRMLAAGTVEAAIAGIAQARSMTMSAGGESVALSPAGAAAALLWIDERQGRLGTPGAMVRKGDRPEGAVPAPPPAPRVVAAPAVSQAGFGAQGRALPAALEALPAVKACREETSHSDWVQKEVQSARLAADTELWGVPCFVGAYNMGHDWYVTGPDGRNPRPAVLAQADGETSAGTINGGYDPRTRTLTAFAKGRGVGDCGTASTWTWTGRAFTLTEETSMTECWGVPADLWPTTWRSR